ncbi:MAG: chloride channel protein [Anaerolineae bacterium]
MKMPARSSRWSTAIARWLDRVQPSGIVVLGVAALAVGVATGIGIWIYKGLIVWVTEIAFGRLGEALAPLGHWTIALVPVVGGLIVGLLLHFFIGEERSHGVAGIMEAVALAGGRLRYKRMPIKVGISGISIGFGASVGPEDPSVQLGANLGSMAGQLGRLSDDAVRTLVAAGAAAAISATFNAPIAGVFFALEIILGELTGPTFGVVILASVASAVFMQAVAGSQPAFHIPTYEFRSWVDLPLYALLGVTAGLIAALYIFLIYRTQAVFRNLTIPRWSKPALAGLLVGCVGIFLPQIFGVGYDTIEKLLNGVQMGFLLVVALLAAKIVMTPTSLAGGFIGGVFAPSLFLGATLGSAYGMALQYLMPNYAVVPPAFALVGMAAVLAGTVRAPLTAILLLFEMTGDYRIILPVMFAAGLSLLVARRLQPHSVYEYGLALKGVRLEHGRDVEVLESISVGEVMRSNLPTLAQDASLATAAEVFATTHHHGLPVVDDHGDLVGIFTVSDLERVEAEEEKAPPNVGAACTRELVVAYPGESIGSALRRMSVRDIGRLPVVARDNPHRLLGVLRRSDLVRAYDLALRRRTAIRQQAHQVRLGAHTDVGVEDVIVARDAPCAGKALRTLQLPRESVIATIRRGPQIIIPHGDTILEPGDVIVIVADEAASAEMRRICGSTE